MEQAVDLLLLCCWGCFLGFIYSLFRIISERRPKMKYFLWPSCGIIIFFATSYFLFQHNHGQVSFFGFPIMVLGFFLFLLLIYEPTTRATRGFRQKTNRCLQVMGTFFQWLFRCLLLPISLLVRGEEGIITTFQQLFQRKKRGNCNEKK